MHIEKYNNNGIDYLRLVEGKRMRAPNGKSRTGKRVLLCIGALSRLDDGKPDYIGRLRQSFREGKPLIKSLEPYVAAEPRRDVMIPFRHGDGKCLGKPKLMAATILDPVFNALGLGALLASVKHESKIRYDLAGIVRLLVYGRILDPASKCATMSQNGRWLDPLVSSRNGDNVYDALTVVEENRRQILRRMNTCITRGTGRKAGTVFYDVTNFFFEVEDADPDEEVETVAADGTRSVETVKGLRQRGVSKENRPQPIVQTGLFLDDQGIPLSIEEFPGNTLDAQTLKDAMRRTVDNFEMGRFILVADRGMYSGTNMLKVTDGGNGYIVAKSLLKSTAAERAWATGPEDWESLGKDLKYKSRTVTRKAVDGNGNPVLDGKGEQRKYEEKVVVYWSRSFYERQRHENKSFLDFVEELRKNPNGFRVTKANYRSLRKFLKKKVVNTETGEEAAGDGRRREAGRVQGPHGLLPDRLVRDGDAVVRDNRKVPRAHADRGPVPRDEGDAQDQTRLRQHARTHQGAPARLLHRAHDDAAHPAQGQGRAPRGQGEKRREVELRHPRRPDSQGAQGMEGLRTSRRGTLHDAGRRRRGHWDDPQGVRRGRHAPGIHERRADQAEVVDIGLLMV